MKKNKILAFMLSLCLTVGLLPSVATFAATTNDVKANTISFNVNELSESQEIVNDNTLIETKGVKGKIAKAALKAGARVFRSSGLKSTLNGLKYLGFSSSTVNNMVKYSNTIAGVLEDLSTWSYVIKDTIYQQLTGALGGGTIARDVAWWVACIIDWGVL